VKKYDALVKRLSAPPLSGLIEHARAGSKSGVEYPTIEAAAKYRRSAPDGGSYAAWHCLVSGIII
jgi:hypothetical protein